MIDFRQFGRFLGNLLEITLVFLLVALILATLTEVLTHHANLAEWLGTASFWLAVAADMVPVLLVMALALWLPAYFVQKAYHLETLSDGINLILHSRLDLRGFGPWAKIDNGQDRSKDGPGILSRLGGPGHLVIYNDSAVLLERGGSLTRVEGAGFPRLDPFERVYGVVDLRPKRSVQTVSALSQEGLPVEWDVELQYQIDGGYAQPTETHPYPISEAAVLRACTCKWVSHGDHTEVLDWEDRLKVEAEKLLKFILAERRMDHLIGLADGNRTAREEIQAQMDSGLRGIAQDLGARILTVRLDNLRVSDAVGRQWIEAWKARWQRWSMDWLAHAEASRIYEYETAKAEAQLQMITQLTQTLRAQISGRIPAQAIPQIILMRLFSVLDRADFAPSSRIFFPTETMRALEGLQRSLAAGAQEAAAVLQLATSATTVAVGGSADLGVTVGDARGDPVPDGTLVHFDATLGGISPSIGFTIAGAVQTTFAAGDLPGSATVTARCGPATGSVTIRVI
jgi:hypothetical protein